MITLKYQDGGIEKSLDLMVDSLSDLDPILRKFGKHLRDRSKQRFAQQGPGWPQAATSTVQRLQVTRTDAVTAQGTVRKSYRKNLGAQLRRQIRAGKASEVALYELERLYRRGSRYESLQGSVGEKLRSWAVEKLRQKLVKAEEKNTFERREGRRAVEKHRMLGKLGSSLRARVSKGLLVLESAVPWAGIHNEGGSAGKGASIPARPFLYLETEDLDVLVDLALKHMTEKAENT